MKEIRKVVRYRGTVQGVGFRFNATHQARGLAITGFVRNEPNGDVLMDVQGATQNINELVKRVGATMAARIDEALIDDRDPLPNRHPFKITY